MTRYRVLRHMIGDRPYVPGDIRDLGDISAAPLLASGAIEPIFEAKIAPEPQNKIAPRNKRKS